MEVPSIRKAIISESHARTLLRSYPGDSPEAWLADQPWQAADDGLWWVKGARDRWTYRVEGLIGSALRVVSRAPDGAVTSWLVELE
jgi:hypothetical protein